MKRLCLFLIAHVVAMEEPTREVTLCSMTGNPTVIQLPKRITLTPSEIAPSEIREIIARLALHDQNVDYIGTNDPDRIDYVKRNDMFFIDNIQYSETLMRRIICIENWLAKVYVIFLDPVTCGNTDIGRRFDDVVVCLNDNEQSYQYHIEAEFNNSNIKGIMFQLTSCTIKSTPIHIHDMIKIIYKSILGFCNKLNAELISDPLQRNEWKKIIDEYFKTEPANIERNCWHEITVESSRDQLSFRLRELDGSNYSDDD